MFRKIAFLCLAFIFQLTAISQSVIPFSDNDFLQFLIDKGFDKNNDGEIDTNETKKIRSLYIYPFHSIETIDHLESFDSLLNIEISEYANIHLIKAKDAEQLQTINVEGGLLDIELENLTSFSTLKAPKAHLLQKVDLRNLPRLNYTDFPFYIAQQKIHLENCPLLNDYKISGQCSNIYLNNLGAPKNGLISFYPFSKINDSNNFHLNDIKGLNKLQFHITKNVDLTITNNLDLKEIEIDGKSNFDSLDLHTNVNLEKFTWRSNGERPFVSKYRIGANYVNIKGLSNLEHYYKTCDFEFPEFLMDSLPSAKIFYSACVDIDKLDSIILPEAELIGLDNYTRNVSFNNYPSLKSLQLISRTDQEFSPELFELIDCPNLYEIQFEKGFEPEELRLKQLPKMDEWELEQILSVSQRLNNNKLGKIELENLPKMYSLKLTSQEDDAPNLNSILIKGLSLEKTNVNFNAPSLLNFQLESSNFKSIDLANSAIISTFNSSENPELNCVILNDINLVDNGDFTKENHTSFSETSCEISNSIKNNQKTENTIFPNPCTDIVNISGRKPESITVYSIDGKEELNFSNTNLINVSILKPGIYILKVNNGTAISTSSFTKL